jgi:hypothetical protein
MRSLKWRRLGRKGRHILCLAGKTRCEDQSRDEPKGNAAQHEVAKLVKSLGRLGDAAKSLDDFRNAKAAALRT